MDYSHFPRSSAYYGGSERKVGILISGHEHIIKFRKRDEFRIRNNHLSEYLGSHVFELLGMRSQETFLGTFDGEQVVVCRNVLESGEQVEFASDTLKSFYHHMLEARFRKIVEEPYRSLTGGQL